MKKIVGLLTIMIMFSFQLMNVGSKSSAQTIDGIDIYTVKDEDTYFKIALEHGVSEIELQQINFNSHLKAGDKIIVPKGITEKEKDLLARLVHAEAKGEPYAGKIMVGLVVLNRMESDEFPDTIKDVIYEKRQFQPVDNGMIKDPAGDESKAAVEAAIALKGQATDALYFFNPDQTSSKWLRTKTVTTEIGNHRFAK
ncbi:cell wall hydrolase [Cytobacillus sp. FJAT-54145]|uniref:Cell wall hydrolase n=1 Tax=Cytobacillus spartinae TaxID=3299023 RepID=A0ABW6KCC3_9BACI